MHSIRYAYFNETRSASADLRKILKYEISQGHAVEKLVEALRYKTEGRRFDSRWCHWSFSLT